MQSGPVRIYSFQNIHTSSPNLPQGESASHLLSSKSRKKTTLLSCFLKGPDHSLRATDWRAGADGEGYCRIYADFSFIKINGAISLFCVGNKDKSYFLTLKVALQVWKVSQECEYRSHGLQLLRINCIRRLLQSNIIKRKSCVFVFLSHTEIRWQKILISS